MNTPLLLDKSICHKTAKILSHFLADSYILYVKTQNFHWNVEDSRFFFLHQFFEEHYKDLAEAIDEIAERMRMLKVKAPGSLKEFLELTSLQEATHTLHADQMIKELCQDHEKIADFLRTHIQEVQKLGDEGSADFLIQRLRVHEKTAWMLRSHFN